MTIEVFIFGASGHAKVVIETLRSRDDCTPVLVFDDDLEKLGATVAGLRVAGGRQELIAVRQRLNWGIVSVGANSARLEIAAALEKSGFAFVSAIHRAAVIAPGVHIGDGSAVMAGAVVNSDVRIGCHVIVNTGASVDHDCVIEDGVHVAPGAILCGGVSVERGVLVGAGSVLVPGVRVGRGAVVGAGAVVLESVPPGSHVAGNPARELQTRA